MIRQDRLPILLALYERSLGDVAAACGISVPYASRLINCHREARPEMIARLEAAITGMPARDVPGARPPRARLTTADVQEIRAAYAGGGMTLAALGTRYGACAATIHAVVRGRSWRDI